MIVENIQEVCGLYFRSILIPKSWTGVDQHIHDHDHANICASGSAQYWEDRKHVRDIKAGDVIEVKANRYHYFVALEPNTRLICVHDIASAESIKQKRI